MFSNDGIPFNRRFPNAIKLCNALNQQSIKSTSVCFLEALCSILSIACQFVNTLRIYSSFADSSKSGSVQKMKLNHFMRNKMVELNMFLFWCSVFALSFSLSAEFEHYDFALI